MTFGLTPTGFNSKRLADIKQDLENAFVGQFGDVNVDPQSVFGQIIGVDSKSDADLWENLEDVYLSQYPDSAEGVSLDNVVALNGITRLPAQPTTVIGVCSGNQLSEITAGSLVKIPGTNNIFSNPESGFIDSSNAYSVTIQVLASLPQVYAVILNGSAFYFSLPILTLSGSFVSGNTVIVTLNGTQLSPVPFNTDSATTNSDVAAMIATHPAVLSAIAPDATHIEITPNLGFNVAINSISVTGTPGASYATTYDTPSSTGQVAEYLSAAINNGSQPVFSSFIGSLVAVTANDPEVPFVAAVQSQLSIIERSSPVLFVCQEFGVIPCPQNTLTEILTPIAGWSSVTNPTAGVTGRLTETDSELRIRRAASIRLAGNTTVEAIRARLLQNVPGVTSVTIIENPTMIQGELDIVFSANFVPLNEITIQMNSRTLPTITYAVSSAATMSVLAALLQTQPEIDSCVAVGNTLEITSNIFKTVEIDSITILNGSSQPTYALKGGIPAKSYETIVEGGSNLAVAQEIWLSKPAGIQTFGNTTVSIVDSQGFTQAISFSRPTEIYIWVQVTLTLYSEESFPVTGIQDVEQSIYEYGSSLGVGMDVLSQRVLCQIFNVPGITGGVIQLAATNNPTDSPVFGSSDITIEENEISSWDLSRITVSV